MFELFYTHPYCAHCKKKIYIWQKGIRPMNAYHSKCIKKAKLNEMEKEFMEYWEKIYGKLER